MACSEGDQLLATATAIMDKVEANILHIVKIMNPKMNLLASGILFQKDSSYNYQFCTKLHAPPSLKHVWVNHKDEVPYVSGFNHNQTLKRHARPEPN